MTRERLEEILAEWTKRLTLEHWDIKVRWEMPVDLGVNAEIKIHADYEQASIRIQQMSAPADDEEDRAPTIPFTDWTVRETHHTIVHELLHIYEKQTARAVQSAEAVMPKAGYEVLWAWYQHGSENWVDRLSRILVDLAGVQ